VVVETRNSNDGLEFTIMYNSKYYTVLVSALQRWPTTGNGDGHQNWK